MNVSHAPAPMSVLTGAAAVWRQIASRNEYDKTIAETEAAYMKILESSQTLLNVLKRETVNLVKKKQTSS